MIRGGGGGVARADATKFKKSDKKKRFLIPGNKGVTTGCEEIMRSQATSLKSVFRERKKNLFPRTNFP